MGMMVNRRRTCGGKKGLLPSGYKQLEYIENTDINAYIDTLVDAGDIRSMTSRMCYTINPRTNIGDGAKSGSWYMHLGLLAANGRGYGGQYGGSNSEREVIAWDEEWHTLTLTLDIEAAKGYIIVDNLSVRLNTQNPPSVNIWLFIRNGQSDRKAQSKRGIVEIYDNNMQPLRYFVPCINPNNVVGMYDTVGKQFYSSPNGVAFVAGPEV